MVIYLDYNATTPVDVEVQNTICSVLRDAWGNPSSSSDSGKHAKSVIEESRRKVAEMIGSAPHEIIFTSGGTESNNMVISTVVQNFYTETKNGVQPEKPHIITTNVEHDSVKLPLESLLADDKAEVTFVPVSKLTGAVTVDDIICAIKPNTCLITIMLANNETGVIQPVSSLRSKLNSLHKNKSQKSSHEILLHTDAAQALGKIDVDVDSLDVDYLTIVGHKFYGPRTGALYFKHGKPLFPIFYGGGQEKNFRPGTENTCMIAGLGKAAELVTLNLEKYKHHMTEMCDYLEKRMRKSFSTRAVFHFNENNRLPNTLSVALNYEATGKQLLSDAKDICASTGAACHSNVEASGVLVASGVSSKLAAKTLRLSVGRETTKEEIDTVVSCLQKAVRRSERVMIGSS